MRKLTIKREQSAVGSLIKMKVCIEDKNSSELIINGTPCRAIGTLENGETKSFLIEENEIKIYVIADNFSKDYCNELYQIPKGTNDVYLCGKNELNPITGNAFRFYNNDSPAVISNRSKSKKEGFIVLAAIIFISIFIPLVIINGTSISKSKTSLYHSQGLNITLPSEFQQVYLENFTAVFVSKDVEILISKEPFDMIGSNEYNLSDYADLVIQTNKLNATVPITVNGLTRFEYDANNYNTYITYHYCAYVFESTDSYWLVQFATQSKKAEKYRPIIEKWADTISFSY